LKLLGGRRTVCPSSIARETECEFLCLNGSRWKGERDETIRNPGVWEERRMKAGTSVSFCLSGVANGLLTGRKKGERGPYEKKGGRGRKRKDSQWNPLEEGGKLRERRE